MCESVRHYHVLIETITLYCDSTCSVLVMAKLQLCMLLVQYAFHACCGRGFNQQLRDPRFMTPLYQWLSASPL